MISREVNIVNLQLSPSYSIMVFAFIIYWYSLRPLFLTYIKCLLRVAVVNLYHNNY